MLFKWIKIIPTKRKFGKKKIINLVEEGIFPARNAQENGGTQIAVKKINIPPILNNIPFFDVINIEKHAGASPIF